MEGYEELSKRIDDLVQNLVVIQRVNNANFLKQRMRIEGATEYTERGEWSAETAALEEGHYYAGEYNPAAGFVETSAVTHNGCKWKCLVSGTTEEPSPEATEWQLIESSTSSISVWLSKVLIPVNMETSEWAEEGEDQAASIIAQHVELSAMVFYGVQADAIDDIMYTDTDGIENVTIEYSEDSREAQISFDVTDIEEGENKDFVLRFFTAHTPDDGYAATLTLVPSAKGEDGAQGAPGAGVGLTTYEYHANDGETPADDAAAYATPTLAGFGPDDPILWQRVKVYTTDGAIVNTPTWLLISRYAQNGKDVKLQYAESETGPWQNSYSDGCIYMRIYNEEEDEWGDPIKIVGEDGSDGEYTDYSFGVSQYKAVGDGTNVNIGPSDITSWSDAPVATTEGKPYLWMRSMRFVRGTSGALEAEKDLTGANKYYYTRLTGEAGVSPLVVDLENEMSSVIVNNSGYTEDVQQYKITAHAFYGTTPATITNMELAKTVPEVAFGLDYSDRSKAIVAVQKDKKIDGNLVIPIKVTVGSETRQVAFTLAPVKAANGKDAEIYELAPRRSSMSFGRDDSGNLIPAAGFQEIVQVKCVKGDDSQIKAISDVEGLAVVYSYEDVPASVPTGSGTATDTLYTAPIQVTAETAALHDNLYLAMFMNGTLIDRETIPILKNGADGINGITPTIGDDGYWYFGNEKSEFEATPKDPDTWTIGEDGCWYFNGEKTSHIAIATDGQSVFVSYVFRRSATTLTSADKPSGGTYANPSPDAASIAAGWSDGIPSGSNPVYMSQRTFTSDGQAPASGWSNPCLMVDTPEIDICYSASATKPGNPASHGIQNDAIWHQEATENDIWMAVSSKTAGSWSSWSITKIKGEKGEDGQDGVSPVVVDLENEMPSIPINEQGAVSADIELGLKIHAFVGITEVSVTSATCAGYSSSSGSIRFNASTPSEPVITFKSGATPAEVTEFEIQVGVQGGYTRKCTFTVAAVKSGGKGEDAVLNELFPSPNTLSFARDSSGNLTGSASVSVLIKKTTGANTQVISIPSTLNVRWAYDSAPAYNAGSQLTAANSTSNVVTVSAANAGAHTAVCLAMYNASNVLLDKETIPIVKDGEKGQDGQDGEDGKDGEDAMILDLDNQMDSVGCTKDGKPTSQTEITTHATLYKGASHVSLTTGVTAGALAGVTAAVTYADGIATIKWTIPTSAALNARYTANVQCSYGGKTYTAVMTLNAVRAGQNGQDGKNPTIYQVQPSVTAVAFSRDADTDALTPSSVTVKCGYTKQVGDGAITSVEHETGTIDSAYKIYYREVTGATAGSWTANPSAGVSVSSSTTKTKIEFCIAPASGTPTMTTIIDLESVPVVKSGAKGPKGEDGAGGIRPNLFGMHTELGNNASGKYSLHTADGIYIYTSAAAAIAITGIEGAGDYFVQFIAAAGSATIGKVNSSGSFTAAATTGTLTDADSNSVAWGKVTLGASDHIAFQVTGTARLAKVKIEEGAGITAPTTYCINRDVQLAAIKDTLIKDGENFDTLSLSGSPWTKSGSVTRTSNNATIKNPSVSISSGATLKQTVSGLTANKRYCLSFLCEKALSQTMSVKITNSASIMVGTGGVTIYPTSTTASFGGSATTIKKAYKVAFVATSTSSEITWTGPCTIALVKLEEGEQRTATKAELTTRDMTSYSGTQGTQVEESYNSASVGMSAGVSGASYVAITSTTYITTPGVAKLEAANTDITVDLSKFSDGDILRLVCGSTSMATATAKVVGRSLRTLSDIAKTPISLEDASEWGDTYDEYDYSITGCLHKVHVKGSGKRIQGCGTLVVNSSSPQSESNTRLAFVGADSISFGGGMIEFVYIDGNLWLRAANCVDYLADYGSSAANLNTCSGGVCSTYQVTNMIDRKYMGDRIQYILVTSSTI